MRQAFPIAIGLVVIFSALSPLEAHPGNTDSAGCHTCRTNCPRWGLKYGEYHCHGYKSSSQELDDTNNLQARSKKTQAKEVETQKQNPRKRLH